MPNRLEGIRVLQVAVAPIGFGRANRSQSSSYSVQLSSETRPFGAASGGVRSAAASQFLSTPIPARGKLRYDSRSCLKCGLSASALLFSFFLRRKNHCCCVYIHSMTRYKLYIVYGEASLNRQSQLPLTRSLIYPLVTHRLFLDLLRGRVSRALRRFCCAGARIVA